MLGQVTAAHLHEAFSQTWPAFALVAGLLLVGAAAGREGIFAAAGALAARVPGGAFVLLAVLLSVEAAVTAVLNLDTAVVFMTPVLLHAARERGADDAPFLYGSVFMANSASLLLPGSNLTNLIVLAHDPVSGSTFAARLWPAWVVAVGTTITFLAIVYRRALAHHACRVVEHPPFRPGIGTAAVVVAALLILVLAHPALPVLALGGIVAMASRIGTRTAFRVANPLVLGAVLAVAVALGTIARSVAFFGDLVEHAGRWETAWLATGAAVLVDNLPSAALLSAHPPAHPRALLLGLDLGPNLAVTGSLSAIFWLQVARAQGARPSLVRYSLLGVVLVPVSLVLSLLSAAGF
jgi:arsenical pump membrane protein